MSEMSRYEVHFKEKDREAEVITADDYSEEDNWLVFVDGEGEEVASVCVEEVLMVKKL